MLNKLSLGRKLALIVLVPFLLFLAFAVPRILDDRSDSSDASDTQARATVSALTWQVFDTVRHEAVVNQVAVGVQGVDGELSAAREATDGAITNWLNGVGGLAILDENTLASRLQDFDGHRLEISGRDAQTNFEADVVVLREIELFDGLLSNGAKSDAVELRNAADLTTVSSAAAELHLLGMWAIYEQEVPAQLPLALGAARGAADAYSLRNAQELPFQDASYTALLQELSALSAGDSVEFTANDWNGANEARAVQLGAAHNAQVEAASTAALAAENDASGAFRNGALLVLGALLVGALLALAVAKAIRASLHKLRDEASNVANSDLPRVAEALTNGVPMADISTDREVLKVTNDEFGEVAASLAAVRESASGVGERVAVLQSGIADTFVNLARRNQSLVDRQLEAIDTLEAEERDSDRLALMYRVDHLATRMRRNAESLLVLADAKTPERHSGAIELREVLRVAIGEVEDYRRIIPIALDNLHVAGHKAQDLAHLLAELMENAAQHSPPGTAVDVSGVLDRMSGSYVVTILDHGTGLDAAQLAQLNELLERPPTSTMTISYSIGLQVVSRLAHALGVHVALSPANNAGLVASVVVPATIVSEWSQVLGVASPKASPVPVSPVVANASLAFDSLEADGLVEMPVPDAIPRIDIPALDLASFGTFPGESIETSAPAFEASRVDSPFESPPFDSPEIAPLAENAPVLQTPIDPFTEVSGGLASEPGPPFEPESLVFDPQDVPVVSAPAPTPAPVAVVPEPMPVYAPAPMPAPMPAYAPAPMPAPAPVAEMLPPTPKVTPSGLTRRTRTTTTVAPVDLEADRTAPSQRTPDQVKNMLSRYKTGLERGRGSEGTDGES
ncbi:MAG: HAMP domain-containing protein/two-component sensor histidine kinase [Verrucomicrobiales bacterium]|jgi:HAMP domain-containing protein/two-component sensor histidine kinase